MENRRRNRLVCPHCELALIFRSVTLAVAWKVTLRWKVTCIVDGTVARICITVLVCINAILIGVEADHTTAETEGTFEALELAFLVVFVVELIAKIFGIGLLFFQDSWNVIDLVVVGASILVTFLL